MAAAVIFTEEHASVNRKKLDVDVFFRPFGCEVSTQTKPHWCGKIIIIITLKRNEYY